MEGRNCQITIDTGSNISIVRPDVLPEKKQSEIQPVNQCIRTVTGEKAPIRGKSNFRLRIGSTEIVHTTWIADIQDECILGLDFLEPHECLVNLRNGTLQMGEEEIPLQKPAVVTTLTSCRAVLETTVILPPQSECVVPAKMDGQWKHKPRWGIMEAGTRNEKKQREIQPVNQCIRTVTGEKAPIRGKSNLRLRIGSTEIVHTTWIADIQDECILGLDFLEPHEYLVNLRNGTLQMGEEEIPLQKPAVVTTLTSCRAVLETTVILPPQSECVVPAKMDGQWKHKPRWGIMEAGTRNKEAESALEGLLVARTLVDLHQPTTVVRMMNLSGQKRAKSRREPKLQDVSKLQVLFCNKRKLQRQNLKCYTSLSI